MTKIDIIPYNYSRDYSQILEKEIETNNGLKPVYEIENEISDLFSWDKLYSDLEENDQRFHFVIYEDGDLKGYIVFSIAGESKIASLESIRTYEEGRNFGGALIHRCIDILKNFKDFKIKKIILNPVEGKGKDINLLIGYYKKFGFRVDEQYYEQHKDDIENQSGQIHQMELVL